MKIVKKSLIPILFLAVGLWIGAMITSDAEGLIDANAPGSANDPLVTKSYVDKQVKGLLNQEFGNIDVGGGGGESAKLTVVELKGGHTLYGKEGTQFIVRSIGKTKAISSNANGIPDLTGGKDLPSGADIPINHLLLFPRDDGRGIKVDASETRTVWVMVIGAYQHVDANGNEVK